MPNTLMTANEAAKKITEDWIRIVNDGREHPLSKGEAVTLFGVAYGMIGVPAKELSDLLADKPRAKR